MLKPERRKDGENKRSYHQSTAQRLFLFACHRVSSFVLLSLLSEVDSGAAPVQRRCTVSSGVQVCEFGPEQTNHQTERVAARIPPPFSLQNNAAGEAFSMQAFLLICTAFGWLPHVHNKVWLLSHHTPFQANSKFKPNFMGQIILGNQQTQRLNKQSVILLKLKNNFYS